MKSKKWIFVLCNFLASFFLVACQSDSNGSQSAVEAIKQKGKLVVATSPDYAPFEFQSLVDGKNQVVVQTSTWLRLSLMNLGLSWKSQA